MRRRPVHRETVMAKRGEQLTIVLAIPGESEREAVARFCASFPDRARRAIAFRVVELGALYDEDFSEAAVRSLTPEQSLHVAGLLDEMERAERRMIALQGHAWATVH
jgi:hypothetical protein